VDSKLFYVRYREPWRKGAHRYEYSAHRHTEILPSAGNGPHISKEYFSFLFEALQCAFETTGIVYEAETHDILFSAIAWERDWNELRSNDERS